MDCRNKCGREANEGYNYCVDCAKKWKNEKTLDLDAPRTVKKWNEDPLVDQLMKMNANLGRLVEVLEKKKVKK